MPVGQPSHTVNGENRRIIKALRSGLFTNINEDEVVKRVVAGVDLLVVERHALGRVCCDMISHFVANLRNIVFNCCVVVPRWLAIESGLFRTRPAQENGPLTEAQAN